MAVFKCKMCGGTLEINNESVYVCEYCGTKQTLPRLQDEHRINLYDRANHFRRNNEFDKAMGIYEQILNGDSTDAEAYWSLVLCRYGIEYVEDPLTHKRMPTINRAQYTAIFDDVNYKLALDYADESQKEIYKQEAEVINNIQRGILEISQKEEPFDVFICYKETDNNGRRTPDSVLANDLYHQLKQEGFKVFFSRITLEDKLGTAYEPYIFAALNSAKIMVVLGTRAEYFNAVWVKNEWSRYLALIKQGQNKMLIPAYKDMDPYDLPEEFSHLQAQDMSKLGFMQDLIRGIKKIVQIDTPKTTVVKENTVVSGNTNTTALLKRTFIFLEDGEWDSADEYCEKVLDIDPENASAYLGKMMVQLQVKTQEGLKDCPLPFNENNNFQKVIRFADKKLKETLIGYLEYIVVRNENARLEKIYQETLQMMNVTTNEAGFKQLSSAFKQIQGYKDAEELSAKCLELAETARKDAIYNSAKAEEQKDQIESLKTAVSIYKRILGWRDADIRIEECEKQIEKLEKREKNNKKYNSLIAIVAISSVALIIVITILGNTVFIPMMNYNNAVKYMEAGEYEQAISAFRQLDGYGDSYTKIKECQNLIKERDYNNAVALMNNGDYDDAIIAFRALADYEDSINKIYECQSLKIEKRYNDAVLLMNEGKYEQAHNEFIALGDYKDSPQKAVELYDKAAFEKVKCAKVGEYITFGKYEQDGNASNGKEDIEWLVLDIKDGKMLVITKYAIESKQYHTRRVDVVWETCSLRTWLNGDFVKNSFSDSEKAKIPLSTTTAHKNPSYNVNSGNSIQDNVFLLSITEAKEYFGSNGSGKCTFTKYVSQGFNSYACTWWLRTPGNILKSAAIINGNGKNSDSGIYVNSYSGVRPAMWIDIS